MDRALRHVEGVLPQEGRSSPWDRFDLVPCRVGGEAFESPTGATATGESRLLGSSPGQGCELRVERGSRCLRVCTAMEAVANPVQAGSERPKRTDGRGECPSRLYARQDS